MAYDAQHKDPKTNKGLVLSREFEYDYDKMFTERGESGECYKSFAKWALNYGAQQGINEIIEKRRVPNEDHDPDQNIGSRMYNWTRMTENILTEQPIKFYSE